MKKTELFITPEEAVKLVGWLPLDELDLVMAFESEINETMFGTQDSYLAHRIKLLTIWNAGRVQGIREVRKKRKDFASYDAPDETHF